jgi:PAS domain S-box-containing protein
MPSDEVAGLYKLLVESVRDYAIFVLDSTGHILTWNIGAQRLKGYLPHEIIGKHFSVFYTPPDMESRKPEIELATAISVGRVEDEGWRVRKDGTCFWANVVITALRGPSGELVGFAKVTRDLSERRAAEQRALEDTRRIAEAEAANRAKSEFLASMSHELRTPLNAIGGYADLLLMGVTGELGPDQREYLGRLKRSQQHLLGIINDLLNFSRIEAGRITYNIETISLAETVRRVLPMIEPQAIQRGINVSVEESADHFALADPSKTEQILLNLLSNAVKFTGHGGSISISHFTADGWSGIRVSDTGIGIEVGKTESIFEPFVQVGRTLTAPQEGTGLGLAISRELARAMGGDITVRSTINRGSTFELTLKKS